jgi:class 3 adenylate cyclase/pSer/pThr/pTyr-binding forkhead associated (FHA) protein
MKQDDIAKLQELVRQRDLLDQELSKLTTDLIVSFVDIVGSTRYFEDHGDLAGTIYVHECIDMLSEVATHHGGTVCKTIGDALMTSYEDPVKAVRAAIAMQLKLDAHNESCPPDKIMHVRIGLNYGKGFVKDKDVFGDVVNTAARIESAAKGDQIFISGDLEAKIRSAKFPVQRMPDLAAKGKAEKVIIYEVLWRQTKPGYQPSAKLPSPTVAGRTPVTAAEKPPSGTVVLSAAAIADLMKQTVAQYSLVVVRPDGSHGQSYKIDKQVCVLGRVEGDILFPEDSLVSRKHARLTVTDEGLAVEDLNSANGVYRRLRSAHTLRNGEVILMGRQMFRFRLPEGKDSKDKTPELVRILPGGIEENHYPLPAGEHVLGRTRGTLNFPEDAYLSSQHARIRNTDGVCVLEDLKAVNGTFVGIRERVLVTDGDIILIGHELLRVTAASL